MPLTFPSLPYEIGALAPHISPRTLEFHHGKHHRAYLDKTNELVAGTSLAAADLPDVVKGAAKSNNTPLFNAAAQAWNHEFFWSCLAPGRGGAPAGAIRARIDAEFSSYEKFAEQFRAAANGHFGSGWVWLVADRGALRIITTPNAGTPLVTGQVPLFTIDLWEHAYYLDYQNRRPDFVSGVLANLANWKIADSALQAELQS